MALRWIVLSTFWGWLQAQRYCPADKQFLHLSHPPFHRYELTQETLWVPVVFHVIVPDSAKIIPYSRLVRQIEILNRDYAASRIQFYLPRYGPGGVATCGVTWMLSPLGNHDWTVEEDTLKKSRYWPPDSFLNIWIVHSMPMQVIGYARSLDDPESLPGVVLVSYVVGEGPGTQYPYHKGRTAVHEVGHVFSLLHPFEGGCRGTTPATCAIEGDQICDTPPQRDAAYDCPSVPPNTCTETPTDQPDPVYNFMGYADDSCMTHFTPLQILRMRTFLTGRGASLISSTNHQQRGGPATSTQCANLLFVAQPSRPAPRLVLHSHAYHIEGVTPHRILLYDWTGRCLLEQVGASSLSLHEIPQGSFILGVETESGEILFFRILRL
ncbi:MAG: zinc metalloprotease [Bacteroidia bacterium]|nr:zinc metalloprotease [Bacteroidia bacterium]